MTIGISKENLEEIARVFDRQNTEYACLVRSLIAECKELDRWILIDDSTPKDKQLLVKFDTGENEVAKLIDTGDEKFWISNDGLEFDYGFDIPTHWKELPEDPQN